MLHAIHVHNIIYHSSVYLADLNAIDIFLDYLYKLMSLYLAVWSSLNNHIEKL